jgi:hypothetical protein
VLLSFAARRLAVGSTVGVLVAHNGYLVASIAARCGRALGPAVRFAAVPPVHAAGMPECVSEYRSETGVALFSGVVPAVAVGLVRLRTHPQIKAGLPSTARSMMAGKVSRFLVLTLSAYYYCFVITWLA